MADFENLQADMEQWAQDLIRKATINLGATRRRRSVRSTWPGGPGAKPGSTEVRSYRGKINASNALKNSLQYNVSVQGKSVLIRIHYNAYGDFIDEGVRGKGKSPWPIDSPYRRNKQPRPQDIKDWMQVKKLRPRDLNTGRFISGGQKSLQFLIGRKIKWYGIEPTNWFTDPLEEQLQKLPPDVLENLEIDVIKMIDNGNNTLGTN